MSPAAPRIPLRPSARVLRVAAMFGLRIAPRAGVCAARRGNPHAGVARDLARRLRPGQIALVSGPSGSGKSRLLRAVAARLGTAAVTLDPALPGLDPHTPLVDCSTLPLPDWLACLARAGLAEAALLTRPVGALSDGQRWRAALALSIARPAPTMLIDEFASILDRATACSVGASLARWVRTVAPARGSARPRVIAAAANDDLLQVLSPDLVIRTNLDAPPEVLVA